MPLDKVADLSDYILYQAPHRAIWRATPHDPFIYISYQEEQLVQTYGNEPVINSLLKSQKSGMLSQLSPLSIDVYRELIEREFIGSAALPIKELPADASEEFIKSRNVIFIVNLIFTREMIMNGVIPRDESTLSLRSPEIFTDNKTPSSYKVIQLYSFDLEKNNHRRYVFLHEMAHALELKHFREPPEWDLNRMFLDEHPFLSQDNYLLDCTRTVMAYTADCPPVLSKEKEFNNKNRGMNRNEIENSYPVRLGDVDLNALSRWSISWESRNNQTAAPLPHPIEEKKLGREARNENEVHTDLMKNPGNVTYFFTSTLETLGDWLGRNVTRSYDNVLNAALNYASDVVSSCPATFPTHAQNYWSSPNPYLNQLPNRGFATPPVPSIGSTNSSIRPY